MQPPGWHNPSPGQSIQADTTMMGSETTRVLAPDRFEISHILGLQNNLNELNDVVDSTIYPDATTQEPLPHVLEWKRVIEHCGTNNLVPQTVYQPYIEVDRARGMELRETIFFQSDHTSELGISLDDALERRLAHLKDKDDRMFVGCGPSVSIRVQWPGYPPWSKQIPTMDFKCPKGHITRAKLANNIAVCIRRFAEYVQNKPIEIGSDRKWEIGKGHINVEDLVLVSLHHVSKGSWQPQLRLRVQQPYEPLLTSTS